jgi:predicted SPOUT superfamily RNA methylase MTH1
VVFGSPKKGIYEILSNEGQDPKNLSDFIVNFLPNQGVATVRTEEALLSTLTVLNLIDQMVKL